MGPGSLGKDEGPDCPGRTGGRRRGRSGGVPDRLGDGTPVV